MMYFRGAVNERVRLTRSHRKLAEQYSPFSMSDESRKELREYVSTRHRGLRRAEHVAYMMSALVDYDQEHSFGGIRTAEEVWRDRKGHCIESNILLHRALHEADINAGMMVVKNPKGYSQEGLKGFGLHPFPTFLNNGTLYVADAVGTRVVREYNRSSWLCQTPLTFIEFVSFCMHDSGEDLGIVHGRYDEALEKLGLALEIDPNNYPVLPTIGNTYFNMWMDSGRDEFLGEAERHYRMLVRRMPDMADSYTAYGEFCLGAYASPEHALEMYKKALKKPTADVQVLWTLGCRFKQLGEKELQHTAEGYTSWLIEHLGIKDYFDGE